MTFKNFRRLFMPYFLVEKNRNPIGTSNPPIIFNEKGEQMVWAYLNADNKNANLQLLRKENASQIIYWDEFDYELDIQLFVDERISQASKNEKKKYAICSDLKFISDGEIFEMIFSEDEKVLSAFRNSVNLKELGKSVEEYIKENL